MVWEEALADPGVVECWITRDPATRAYIPHLTRSYEPGLEQVCKASRKVYEKYYRSAVFTDKRTQQPLVLGLNPALHTSTALWSRARPAESTPTVIPCS